ncbi:MAG TPA: hypothetical protein VMV82_07970 [Candidatus Dormibacteraeota bacterium]|nr:hypothetical protein [Candidatus Dormibacteraeota bacterium]
MSRMGIAALSIAILIAGCAHHDASGASPVATASALAPPLSRLAAPLPSVAPSPSGLPALRATPPPAAASDAPAARASPAPSEIPAAPQPVPTPQALGTFPLLSRSLDLPSPRPRVIAFATLPPARFDLPDASPRIIDVYVPSYVVVGGQTVTGDVIASSNTASVEVRVAGYAQPMRKIGPGQFTITVTVPRLPFFLRRRTYMLEIVARNTRGDAVSQALPIIVR